MLDLNKPTLYLIRGISGSGKTSLASEMSHAMQIAKFEADDFFYNEDGLYKFEAEHLALAHRFCQKNAIYCMKRGWSAIVSNTSTTEKEVQVYKDIAEAYNANFVSIIVENRNGTTSVHDVPEEVLKKQRQRFSVKL
jgi:predicted kinase